MYHYHFEPDIEVFQSSVMSKNLLEDHHFSLVNCFETATTELSNLHKRQSINENTFTSSLWLNSISHDVDSSNVIHNLNVSQLQSTLDMGNESIRLANHSEGYKTSATDNYNKSDKISILEQSSEYSSLPFVGMEMVLSAIFTLGSSY